MKNNLLQRYIILCAILSVGVFAGIVHAQTSAGCDLWNTTGSITMADPFSITFGPVAFFAEEDVTVIYSLDTATTATVQLTTPSGTQQQTFTTGSISLSYIIPTDGDYSLTVANTVASDGDVLASFDCDAAPVPDSGTGDSGISAIVQAPITSGFSDGRINFRDAAAPIVVYPYQDTSGAGVDIYLADGTFAYRATADDLANLPISVEGYGIQLSTTEGGAYRITAPQYNGKIYILEFDAPYQHIGYVSYEVE